MTTLLSESEFRIRADEALEHAERSLSLLADESGFEVERQNGVLQIAFDEPSPAKFIVSPNAPVRQIWVSALARSYKVPWSNEAAAFVLDGEPLSKLLDRLVHQHLDS